MKADPEVDVKASGRHHRVITQRIINPNVLINLCPHRYGIQQRIYMDQSGMIQSWADLLVREVRKVDKSNRDKNISAVGKRKSYYRQTSEIDPPFG